jgi:hypothetical protein
MKRQIKSRKQMIASSPLKTKNSSQGDFQGRIIPLSGVILKNRPDVPYFDFYEGGTYGTSPTSNSMLGGLLSSTGILSQFPSIATPNFSTGGFTASVTARVHILYADVHIKAVGSQSNTIVAGDLYNTLRIGIFQCGENYSTVQQTPYSSNQDFWYDTKDLERVLYDEFIPLPSQAFDTLSNYNVPQVVCKKFRVPINLRLDCISTAASGTGAWNTKKSDLFLSIVSDSTVAPNPNVITSVRFYFKVVKN